MILSGRATLSVTSSETDPSVISTLLGLEPTGVIKKGTVRRSGRVADHHKWSVDVDEIGNTGEDQTGTHALRALLALTRSAIGRVPTLPQDCVARIWWSAYSDSVQSGFVLPADLAASIGELGVDVYGTVYLEGTDAPASEAEA